MASPEDVFSYEVSPEKAVIRAQDMKARSIAYSYVEPVIFYEYMMDIARHAKKAGLLNVMHSNGFINEAPLRDLCKVLDAAQVDLKGFTETFYRELPAIDQHTRALEKEFERRYKEAVEARAQAYGTAVEQLHSTPGWEQLDEEKQEQVAAPLAKLATAHLKAPVPIPQLRTDVEACGSRLNRAIEEMMRMVDGQRIVTLDVTSFFKGGIETEEQLEEALKGLREECERLIGAGKKVLLQ